LQLLTERLTTKHPSWKTMPSRGEMAGQDFNTVTFGSRPGGGGTNAASVKQAQRSGVAVDTSRRTGVGNSNIASTGLSAAKLDNETEELKHQTVDKELRLAMMKARTAKGLTQARARFSALAQAFAHAHAFARTRIRTRASTHPRTRMHRLADI